MKFTIPLLALLALLGGCATTTPDATTPTPSGPDAVAAADAPASAVAAQTPVAVAAAASAAQAAPMAAPQDPLRPEVPVDLDDRSAKLDLWDRIRAGFAVPDLESDLVRRHEQWYATRPDYVQRMTERGSRYLFHIVEEVEKRGLPTELALLPFIESAFNPQAVSHAKASGMWQFMPATGRHFDLTQNVFRDDRRDVLESTRAALDYLTYLHKMFGDWHLALAAYNWGEGNVQRAIARNRKARKGTGYEDLRMPAETRHYVPKLQAVKNIVLAPDAFSLALPELENHPYFLTVAIERDMDVEVAARLAGLELDTFRQLNPQLNKPVILAAGTPRILLPYENANMFVRNIGVHMGPLATWTAWTVPETLKPADVAKRVGMSEAQLREVNHIPPRVLVKAGSTLLVPRNGHGVADVPEHLADSATLSFKPESSPGRRVVVKTRKGDTVARVAQRYGVSAAQVASWNSVDGDTRFKTGTRVVVYLTAKKALTQSTRKASTKKATPKSPAKRAAGRASKPAASARAAR